MSSTLILALVAAAIVVGAFVLIVARKPALPKGTARSLPPPPPKVASSNRRAATPAKVAQQPRISSAEQVLDSPDLPEVSIPPKPTSSAPPPPPPRRGPESTRPTAEDIATLKKGLASTRGGFIARLSRLFSGKREIDAA